jgi:hypothetical protein
MAWTELLIIGWSALFVVSVAIMTQSDEESPSWFARAALLVAGGSVLARLGVVLWWSV